jgi:hypothetical protein
MPKERFFEVSKPIQQVNVPAWQSDERLMRAYGEALAKNSVNPFQAACEVFGKEINAALWASNYWLTNPVVVAARDEKLKSLDISKELLNKDALAKKLLNFADERSLDGRFPLHDSKDRLAALKLYAEIMQFIGQASIDMSNKTFTNNVMNIKFVKPDRKEEIEPEIKTIEHNVEEEKLTLPVKIKLVSNSRN